MYGMLRNTEIGFHKCKTIESVSPNCVSERTEIAGVLLDPPISPPVENSKIQGIFEPLLMSGGEGSPGG